MKEHLCGVNGDDNTVQIKRVAEDIIIRVNDKNDGMTKGHEAGEEGALPIIRVDGPYGSPNEVGYWFKVKYRKCDKMGFPRTGGGVNGLFLE